MTGLSGPRYHWKGPFYDNVSRRCSLCWFDNWRQHWTEIHMYGLKCGLFGIALHLTGRAAMHVVVPNSTEQDCGVLDSVAFSCSRLDGTGLGWALTDCTALHCTRLDYTWLLLTYMDLAYAGLKCTWLEGNELELDGCRFHRMDWTARQWSGPDWTEPDSTSEDWNGRHALH